MNKPQEPEHSKQLDILGRIEKVRKTTKAAKVAKVENSLEPERHLQKDFFSADIVDCAFKDDQASMEAPVFSLATKEDLKIWKWVSVNGDRSVEVAPSVYGRATIHDKDVLIYCASQLTDAINHNQPISRTVRFTAYNFLIATNRATRGDDYERLLMTLQRLKGTTITTNILTGKKRPRGDVFGLIDSASIIKDPSNDSRMVAIEITLSEWLYNAIQAQEVLTIHKDYFRLRKPLERRLYEIARKHVGKQQNWRIGLESLKEKCGSTQKRLRGFKAELLKIIESDTVPEYQIRFIDEDMIEFSPRKH
jgi:plasmid replication initiation protein